MNSLVQLHFPSQSSFRVWMEDNYCSSPGIWMVFYKKHTGTACIEYREALEEALCFGWIDSLIKKLDEDRYARKFTPRTNHNKWSEINLRIVEKLIGEGRMKESGLHKIPAHLFSGVVSPNTQTPKEKIRKELTIPDFILEEYALNEPALIHFLNLPQSCKREYVGWITQAKREETIRKRLNESIFLLKENKKLGLK
jgi:uncharacterized protein YdeI (YjbR/CyaY-like superfamily)